MIDFIKSPFNYMGNKFKLLPTLFSYFPEKIDNFVDLFGGGGDVSINMVNKCNQVYMNDINKYIINIFKEFQKHSDKYILDFIEEKINFYKLSLDNSDGYYKYREAYNTGLNSTYLDLYTLSRYSFDSHMRFNEKGEMNEAAGTGKTSFNNSQKERLLLMLPLTKKIIFSNLDFREFNFNNFTEDDFIYLDPPYFNSNADYNNRFIKWSEKEQIDLLNLLKEFTFKKIKFAMNDFIFYKEKNNINLIKAIKENDFFVYPISTFLQSSYNSKIRYNNQERIYQEVIVTNYSVTGKQSANVEDLLYNNSTDKKILDNTTIEENDILTLCKEIQNNFLILSEKLSALLNTPPNINTTEEKKFLPGKTVKKYSNTMELLEIYHSTVEAGEKNGVQASTIQRYCRGVRKDPHGFIWKYEED